MWKFKRTANKLNNKFEKLNKLNINYSENCVQYESCLYSLKQSVVKKCLKYAQTLHTHSYG